MPIEMIVGKAFRLDYKHESIIGITFDLFNVLDR